MNVLVEPQRVRVSGGELSYVDVGDGPPVLLLHGFPASGALWRRDLWLFARRMRVVAPDLLGYGRSDGRLGADLSPDAQSGYIGELARQLGLDRVAVVGHGVGATVAQLVALRGDVEVGAMVLIDAAPFGPSMGEALAEVRRIAPDEQTGDRAEELVRSIFARGMAHPERLDHAMLDELIEQWRANPPALFRAADALAGDDLAPREAELANLDMPVLVLWGEEDRFFPAALAERLGDALAGATVALLPGCGHFVTEDAAATVAPIVAEYLRSRYVGESHQHPTGPVPVFLHRPPRELDMAFEADAEDG